jgi:hypothetical protein
MHAEGVDTRKFLRETLRVAAYSEGREEPDPLARWTLPHWCLHYWLARYCADHRIALEPQALEAVCVPEVGGIDPALPKDLTPHRWQAFLDDYFRFMDYAYRDIRSEAERERRRKHIIRAHGLTLPDDVETDDHRKHRHLCVSGLAHFDQRCDAFATYQPLHTLLRTLPMKSSYHRLQEWGQKAPGFSRGMNGPSRLTTRRL